MTKLKKNIIKTTAADDAKWNNCFVNLQSIGIKTNTRFTAYDPPKDPKDKLEYYRNWKKAKAKYK